MHVSLAAHSAVCQNECAVHPKLQASLCSERGENALLMGFFVLCESAQALAVIVETNFCGSKCKLQRQM